MELKLRVNERAFECLEGDLLSQRKLQMQNIQEGCVPDSFKKTGWLMCVRQNEKGERGDKVKDEGKERTIDFVGVSKP